MKTTLMVTVAVLIAAGGVGLIARAQQAGTKRIDLQRHDLSAPGREMIQVRVDFDPGYVAPAHPRRDHLRSQARSNMRSAAR